MIRTEGLTKRFGGLVAVDGLDLDVREGDLFGFLGPNGSGKTTTVRMLLGLVFATSGRVEVLGRPMPKAAREVLPQVGSLVEGPAFYPHLSGRANLSLFDAAGPPVPRTPRRPPDPAPAGTGGGGSTRRWSGSGWTRSGGGRSRPGRPGCASGSGWPRRCCGRRGCWCWTSRPTGSTRTACARSGTCWSGWSPAGRRCSCPATCWPRSSSSAPGRRSSTGAGWSPRTGWRRCSGRPGGCWSPPRTSAPRPTWRPALPGVRLGERRPGRLAVHLDGTAPEALNRRLVDGGVRVRELVVERPSLEDVFLRLTGGLAGPGPGTPMFRVELRKLVGRPRTWVTIGLLAGLPALVAVLLRVTGVGPRPGEGPAFLAQVLGNGALFPAAALALVLPVFLPVAVAVLAGDTVAGEASAGTLRYLLVRPVGRTRLLVAKLGVTVVFVFLAVLVVAAVAFAVGAWLFGVEPLPSVSGQTIAAQDATWRTAVTVAYVAWSMLGVAAVALFASTVTDSPLAAALGALAALVTSQVLDLLDAAAALKPYLPTHYWLAFVDLFRTPVLWRDVGRGFAVQAVFIVVFLGAAWANFATKDIKS